MEYIFALESQGSFPLQNYDLSYLNTSQNNLRKILFLVTFWFQEIFKLNVLH